MGETKNGLHRLTMMGVVGQHLRCSMHGIIYDVKTGESLSTMCQSEKLTAVKIQEDEQGIWIVDKRVKPLPAS